jgi:hypothetical protein
VDKQGVFKVDLMAVVVTALRMIRLELCNEAVELHDDWQCSDTVKT